MIEADAVGDVVRNRDLLYTLYSPELISAQKDLLTAQQLGHAGRINASVERLRMLGLDNDVIARVQATGRALDAVPFHAGHHGVIATLYVRQGGYVKAGAMLLALQDYSRVWIEGQVAEKDLRFIRVGQRALVTLIPASLSQFESTVDYIYPVIDATTRTGRVWIVLGNADGLLKPGGFADVTIHSDVKERLAVPTAAVLRDATGDRVIVAKDGGRFAPREVETGLSADGFTEILFGLEAGENIVVSGQFLIDSEANLREAMSKMGPEGMDMDDESVQSTQDDEVSGEVDQDASGTSQ